MTDESILNPVQRFFGEKFAAHGTTPTGLDWPSQTSMDIRFEQILKVCDITQPFSILDFGCGYGALFEYVQVHSIRCEFYGYDIVDTTIQEAVSLYGKLPYCHFSTDLSTFPVCDYVVESGVFNMRLNANDQDWMQHVLSTLHLFDRLSRKGFAFNMLTHYSDEEYIRNRPELYYADPCFFFDYCKRNFSRNVALLHDYEIYDFTILVRKNNPS